MINIKQIKSPNAGPILVQGQSNIISDSNFTWNNERLIVGFDQSSLNSTWGHTFAAPTGSTKAFSIGNTGLTRSFFEINIDGSFSIGRLDGPVSVFSGNGINTFSFNGSSSQYVGINVSVPTSTLQIKGIDATFSNSPLLIENISNGVLINIRNNGNVGINTSAVSNTKLLVEGAVAPSEFLFKVQSSNYTNGMTYVDGIGNLTVRGFDGSYSDITSFHNVNDARLTINGKSESIFNVKRDNVDRFKIQVSATDNNFHYHYQHTVHFLYSNVRHLTDTNVEIMYHDYSTGFTGIGINLPTSSLHIKGIDATSSNYAVKVDNVANSSLFSITNDGISQFNGGDLQIYTTGGNSFINVNTYRQLKISMSGSYGDFITMSNTTGITKIERQLIIGNGITPSANVSLDIGALGSSNNISSLGVRNISLDTFSSGGPAMAIGKQGSYILGASPMMRFLYLPLTFGDVSNSSDTNHFRVGFGVDVVNTHRVNIIDGLKVNSATGYNQLTMETSYTPANTSDTNGSTGDISWDDNFIYIKTSAGWKRSTLNTF